MFKRKQLSGHPLAIMGQVLFEDVQELNKDYLCLYVEKAGMEVENIVFFEDNQSAILTEPKGKGFFSECANTVTPLTFTLFLCKGLTLLCHSSPSCSEDCKTEALHEKRRI